jgi:hypothetical protein
MADATARPLLLRPPRRGEEVGSVVLELRCRRAFNTVIEVLRDGLTVVEVAELYGVSCQAVHGWLRRYSARGDVGDSRVVG